MNKNTRPYLWVLWHPHQGLWNWELTRKLREFIPRERVYKGLYNLIVHIDSFILLTQAVSHRLFSLGITKIFSKAKVPDHLSILYLDLGTHKHGNELKHVINKVLPVVSKNYKAYAFEADTDSFEIVTKEFSAIKNIELINKALVYSVPPSGRIRLFKDKWSGLGNSIYRQATQYDDVACCRLSDFLVDKQLLEDNQIILLRMNIEGAEYDVVKDLVEKNLNHRIDGYFGMWDDVSKIDLERDNEFRKFLRNNQIHTFTFNGRDLPWRLRMKAIDYQLHTRIMVCLIKQQNL